MYGTRVRRGLAWRGVAVAAVAALVAGCSSTTSGDPQSDPNAAPPAADSVTAEMSADATSGERIAAALQAGEIDEPTALLYQVWAQFGDTSLPEQFQGAAAPHNLGVLAEAKRSLDELPEDIRRQIAPFFERPSDPDSAFTAGGDDDASGMRASGNALAAAATPQRCSTEWISEPVPDLPLRVWACPDSGNAQAADVLATTIDVLGTYAADMFAEAPDGLGAPIPDDPSTQDHPDADERIDLYALPNGWLAPYREGNERHIGQGISAVTMAASPETATSSSGYIAFRADETRTPIQLANTLVHELFHVQQFAHFQHDAGLAAGSAWAYDATAVWAGLRWVARVVDEQDRPTYTPHFLQSSELSIHDPDWTHGYAAFLWEIFLEQELGADAIFRMWDTMDSVPSDAPGGAAIAAIEQQIDLTTAFPEFAMRLFNADLPGDPIETRFVDALPTFRDGVLPDMTPVALRDAPVEIDHAGIPGLGYRYSQVSVDASAQYPFAVTVTTDLATDSGAAVSVQALVPGVDGDYTREAIDPAGSNFCVSDDVYLVVANTSVVIDDDTAGSVTIAPADDPSCGSTPDISSSPETPPSTPMTTPSSPPDPPTDAASCDDAAGWDTAREESSIGLNAPIVSVTGQTTSCYDTITIGLDAGAGVPGYVVDYVAEVSEPGTGHEVSVAGSHALSVIIDSPTADLSASPPAPTVETSDDMVDVTGFGAVKQVAHAGSFEGMTTFAVGVDGKQPFTVRAEPGRLVIMVARADDGGGAVSESSGATAANTAAPGGNSAALGSQFCTDWRAFSLEVAGIADLVMLPYTLADVEEIFAQADPYLRTLPDGVADHVRTLRAFIDQGANLSAADAADILDDSQVRQAMKSINATYGMYCYDDNGQPIGGR